LIRDKFACANDNDILKYI